MRAVLALLAVGGAFLGCLAALRVLRRRPLGLDAPLALALLVVAEAAALRGLSSVRAVSPGPVLAVQLLIAACGAAAVRRSRGSPRLLRPPTRLLRPIPLAVAALLALVAVAALTYRPNNWDSMTYHLARVAHWIQNRSVAAYPTASVRQTALPPGAEYLLLVLQVIAGSDRLANLVQLGAWGLVVGAAAPLARCFGATRRIARAATLLVASAPMALLQASSTQNDLVAAALGVAAAAAALPLLHARPRARDLLLVLAATAAALLVKPSALAFAAPLLAVAGLRWARAAVHVGGRHLAAGTVAVAAALALAIPTSRVARRLPAAELWTYAGLSAPLDRLENSARGAMRQLWIPDPLGAPLSPAQTVGCGRPRSLCLDYSRWSHEDFAGNPALAWVIVAALVAASIRRTRLPGHARMGVLAFASGWVLFHALIRDNAWIPRLQLPAAGLAPIVLGAFPRSWIDRRAARAALAATLVAAFTLGVVAAVGNERRPLQLGALRAGATEAGYYAPDVPPRLARWHGEVLDRLLASGCRRLAIDLGEDSYDYPLTWRAMQRGVEVRPWRAPEEWACALASDRGPGPPAEGAWRATTVPGLFLATGQR